jgi:glycosyltransferase involved in cell wall biosynthesis
VARQSYRPIQVVIVDDGSHDNSGEIISGFHYKALEADLIYKAIILSSNRGKLAALNVALQHVRGPVCVILDADDHFTGTFVERSIQALARQRIRNSNVGFVYIDCMLTNDALEPLRRWQINRL